MSSAFQGFFAGSDNFGASVKLPAKQIVQAAKQEVSGLRGSGRNI